MYERLTQKQSAGYDLVKMNGEWCNLYCEKQPVQHCNNCAICEAVQRLAQYEDTNLSPQDCMNYKLFEDELITKGITFDKILELVNKEIPQKVIRHEGTYKGLMGETKSSFWGECPTCRNRTESDVRCDCGQLLNWDVD